MNEIGSVPRIEPAAGLDSNGARYYYNISQAAELLGASRVSVWRWIRAGRLPVARLGHRTVRIKREDLDRLVEQLVPAGSRAWMARSSAEPAGPDAGPTSARVVDSDWRAIDSCEHFVQFYEADGFLLDAVADFAGTALQTGDSAIVVATPSHRDGVAERLRAYGPDVAEACAGGRYLPLDAAETLASFMVDGAPDPQRFRDIVGEVVAQATVGGRRVRVFGEMVALLALEGNHAGAARLEELWNDLLKTREFALFCAYPMNRLAGQAVADLLDEVCATHSRVLPAESYTALPDAGDRLRAVTVLQQKAVSLEAEIEQRKLVEEQLRVALLSERGARESAEAALRVRDEFLSVAAHELKTPLTSLWGQAQLVLRRLERDGHLEPERVVRALHVVTDQANRLSSLVGHLLDISRLEAGRLTLEPRPTDLVELVQQVVSGARVWSERHPITVSAPTSLAVDVDPLRLEQVLTNLLDNAVKYSPDGGPIEVVLVQGATSSVELSVRDHGLGIPPEKRAQIFERFYQAHGDDHRSGLGLGLYICRQIVELHGGEIRAEFPADGGSRFVVRLPIASLAPSPERLPSN